MSSPSNIDISGNVKPSAALEVRGEMGVDAVYAKTGLRMVNTLHTSTVLDGLLQLKDGRIFNFDLNMPTNKMEIFSAEYVKRRFHIHRTGYFCRSSYFLFCFIMCS